MQLDVTESVQGPKGVGIRVNAQSRDWFGFCGTSPGATARRRLVRPPLNTLNVVLCRGEVVVVCLLSCWVACFRLLARASPWQSLLACLRLTAQCCAKRVPQDQVLSAGPRGKGRALVFLPFLAGIIRGRHQRGSRPAALVRAEPTRPANGAETNAKKGPVARPWLGRGTRSWPGGAGAAGTCFSHMRERESV